MSDCSEERDELFIPLIERIEKLEQARHSTRAAIIALLSSGADEGSAEHDASMDLLLPSCVYFVAAETFGQVKIGFSRNLSRRIRALQTSIGCPLRLLGAINGSIVDEHYWHSLFANNRVHGEWFVYDDAMRAAIRGALGRRSSNEEAEPLHIEMMCLGEDIEDVFAELRFRGHTEGVVREVLTARQHVRSQSDHDVLASPEVRS